MRMPVLETARLAIRPFTLDDLDAVHELLDRELGYTSVPGEQTAARGARRAWLEWTVLNYEALALLYQPPYGDRAVVLNPGGELIGVAGYVPCLGPFEQIPGLRRADNPGVPARATAEVGLYWAIGPAHQRHGYAGEAGGALIDYAFSELRLKRIVALTTYDNTASIGVMRRLGMRIEHNPDPEPPWLQVVGIAEPPG